jgi:hypothetical protein
MSRPSKRLKVSSIAPVHLDEFSREKHDCIRWNRILRMNSFEMLTVKCVFFDLAGVAVPFSASATAFQSFNSCSASNMRRKCGAIFRDSQCTRTNVYGGAGVGVENKCCDEIATICILDTIWLLKVSQGTANDGRRFVSYLLYLR